MNPKGGLEPLGPRDAGGFATLVERHGAVLYRRAFRLTGNDQDARDVVQEAFYRAYRGWRRFQGRADPGTWLHRVVVNCALDLLRVRRRRPDLHGPRSLSDAADELHSSGASPERLAASAEAGRRIQEAMGGLKAVERVAFTLRHCEGRTTDEIARTLGVGHAAAKQHVFRAVRKLRAALEGHEGNT